MAKIGRNDRCHCGSGKKYKKCCLILEDLQYLQQLHYQANLEFDRKKSARNPKYGDVRPFVHSQYSGKKVVAVSNRLHFLNNCKTVPDFLQQYIKLNFGKTWWLEEVDKIEHDRHPVIQQAFEAYEAQKDLEPNEKGLIAISPNGPQMAHLTLGYDLFTLKDNAAFQNKILKRMRLPDHYQGARYELLVASTFVRAGFEIAYEDEKGAGGTKHPEFIATHKVTGQKIAVEAKRRHREGLEKEIDEKVTKLGMRSLLVKAIKKEPALPFVVFLDLNIPAITDNPLKEPWIAELNDLMSQDFLRDESSGKDKCNLAFFTNYPVGYSKDTIPRFGYVYTPSPNPLYPFSDPKTLDNIIKGLDCYGKIPNFFDE